jgi:peptidoglycan-associated lipoprotein
MKKVGLSILLVSMLAACASQKPKEETAAAPEAAQPAATTAAVAVDPLNDPNSILAKRSVFYPFDVSVVQDADKPLLQAHAKYLSEHPDRHVRLEGNCDERGSTEYNIGLGQRRADGVKKLLELDGANASQITTVSYGEEKPKMTCHAERCWKENRRTDLDYSAN